MSPTQHFIENKAMLVCITINGWKGQIKDKKATEQTRHLNNAKEGSGKFIKNLIDQEALAEIGAMGKLARTKHYMLTLPWDDSGYRLLPTTTYDKYREEINRIFEQRIAARNRLIESFDKHKEAAKDLLGSMFRPEEYPTTAKLSDKITARYQISPVYNPSHFLVDMQDQESTRIKKEMEDRIHSQIKASVQDLYLRLKGVIAAAAERLDPNPNGKPKTFRDSLVNNIHEVLDIVPQLNITGDENLARICKQLRDSLAGIQPDHLREKSKLYDPGSLKKVATTMKDLNTQFGGYFS